LGCFSFYPGKNLGAYGEGGIVVTKNPDYARKARMLRDWGQAEKYEHVLKGYNYRMDGLQGAILRVKLRHLDAWTNARRAHAQLYNRLLAGNEATLPTEMSYARHVYHLYVVRTANRDALHEHLHRHDIHAGIHYPIPVHLQPAYRDLGYGPGDFPRSERAAAEVLSLPLHPELRQQDHQHISQCVNGSTTCLPASHREAIASK
jgi:dTDP-4-amino-4,6-dideoxygalactose transaminase